jgi:hypothetical protein
MLPSSSLASPEMSFIREPQITSFTYPPKNKGFSQKDLKTHFMVGAILNQLNGAQKAYIFWGTDKDGKYRSLDEFNLSQLGVEILDIQTSKDGAGQLYFRGQLSQKFYPKI